MIALTALAIAFWVLFGAFVGVAFLILFLIWRERK